MDHSPTLGALAAALCQAQESMKPAAMNATNPFLKNKYADLGAVLEAARPGLAANGLSVSQMVTGSGAEMGVTTVLMHNSGEWLASTVSLPMVEERGKSMAQVAGSVITYLRRYALAAALGIYADEDTDGHLPQQDAPRARQRAAQPAPAPARAPRPGGLSTDADGADFDTDAPAARMADKTRARMFALFGERGIADAQTQRDGMARILGHPVASRSNLTEHEARLVIASLERKPT